MDSLVVVRWRRVDFIGDGDTHPLGNPRWMGMFEDCGGKLSQLYVAKPKDKVKALYCNDPRINMHGIAMPSYFNNGGRRLTGNYEEQQEDEEEVDMNQSDDPRRRRRMEDLVGDELFEQKAGVVKRSMDAPLTQVHRRGLQADYDLPQPSNLQCSMAYQSAFVSTISGPCAQSNCASQCQQKISDMLAKCKNVTYTKNDTDTGLTIQRSFSQKAVLALQLLGPQNCDYGLLYGACSATCTITNASATLTGCATFFMGVDFHAWDACADPLSTGDRGRTGLHHCCQTPDGAIQAAGANGVCQYPSQNAACPTQDVCFQRYLGFLHNCQGCVDPFVSMLLAKISRAVAASNRTDAVGCEDCADKQKVAHNIAEVRRPCPK